jgi:hypothetical protein
VLYPKVNGVETPVRAGVCPGSGAGIVLPTN